MLAARQIGDDVGQARIGFRAARLCMSLGLDDKKRAGRPKRETGVLLATTVVLLATVNMLLATADIVRRPPAGFSRGKPLFSIRQRHGHLQPLNPEQFVTITQPQWIKQCASVT